MLVDKQSELMSDLLFTVHQHGGDDVTWKPPKHRAISYYFTQQLAWTKTEHVCIINLWGFVEILPYEIPGNLKLTSSFNKIFHFILQRTYVICLEISSNFKRCLELEVAWAYSEISMFSSHGLTPWVSSQGISTKIVTKSCPKHLMFVWKCQTLLDKELVL